MVSVWVVDPLPSCFLPETCQPPLAPSEPRRVMACIAARYCVHRGTLLLAPHDATAGFASAGQISEGLVASADAIANFYSGPAQYWCSLTNTGQ